MNKEATIVTGASNGIGRGIAARLASDGDVVINLDRVPPKAESPARYYEVDFADSEATIAVLKKVCSEYRVTRLVNNVGIVRPALIEIRRRKT